MSKLETKLRELAHKRARRDFLALVEPSFSELLSDVSFSHDVQCLKYAAFSTWDIEVDKQTTTRGEVLGWELRYFDNITEIVNFIRSSFEPTAISGWFFIDTDGPYYSLSLSEFLLNLNPIQKYCEREKSYDIGWVGQDVDMGIVLEFNQTSFCRNQLEVCTWGM